MTAPSTNHDLSPASGSKGPDLMAILPSGGMDQNSVTAMHGYVQECLRELENHVRGIIPEVQVVAGHTAGEHFLLFAYRTFSVPDSDVDPVVAGMTITKTGDRMQIEADVSGEQTGDWIATPQGGIVVCTWQEMQEAARELASGLNKSGDAVAAALTNPARRIP